MGEFDIVKSLLGMTLWGAEWVLWLLIILSIASVAIIIERILFFARIRVNVGAFIEDLSNFLASGDHQAARELCLNRRDLPAKVARVGLENNSNGLEAMKGSMEGTIVRERPRLDQGLVVLGTLGNNAPFIGLFGTVIGIIKAFNDLALNPAGGPSVVMAGISEALVATAVGLMVAIPAVIAYNAFSRVVKKHVSNAQAVLKLITTYAERRN